MSGKMYLILIYLQFLVFNFFLQKIHVMYNLSTVLDEHTGVSRALNDSELKNDMELLEKEYLDATKQNVSL